MHIEVKGANAVASGAHMDLVNLRHNLPGRRREINAGIKFELSLANIRYINNKFPKAVWSDPGAIQRLICAEADRAEKEKRAEKEIPDEAYAFPFKTEPYEHQLRGFYRCKDAEYFGLFFEMGCVDKDTEYLSPNGWVKISEYDGGKVAQWDAKTGQADFVKPLRYIKEPCDKMIRFKTECIDQVLSFEHKVPIMTRPYSSIKNYTAKHIFDRLQENRTSIALPSTFFLKRHGGLGLPENDLRLQVAINADGSFHKSAPKSNRVTIALKKSRKIKRLNRLLKGRETYIRKNKAGYTVFSFSAPLRTKLYDSRFWESSYSDLKIITNEVLLWDGSLKSRRFYSKHESDIDFIQYAFAATGHKCSKGFDGRGVWYLTAKKSRSPYYIASDSDISIIDSPDGFKYCFTVPSGYLILRRNGCIFPTGNCGKTKVVCDKAAYSYGAGRIRNLLVAAPSGVSQQWVNEQVPQHMPDFVNYNALVWQSNHTKKWTKQFNDLIAAPNDVLRILSMNVEAFSTKKGFEFAQTFIDSAPTLFCIDESQTIKTPGAKRTKNILKLGKSAAQRMILSGTPVSQGIEDLFSQLKFLHEDILGFSSFWSFKDYYCIQKAIPGAHYAARKIVGYKNVDEIKTLIDSHAMRVTKADCLDLPEKIYMRREVPLTPAQKKAYNELKKDLITQLESGEVVSASIAAVKVMKMQQVLCGFLIPGEDEEPVEIKSNRGQVTIDLINEAAGKVIVWCRFRHDIEMLKALCDKVGIRAVTYYGETSAEDRVQALKNFKTGSVKVFIANPASAGTGLNLAEANTAIYYSNDFNSALRWQSEDRIHRIGQTNACTYVDLIAPDSIDAKILDALRKKKNVADSVLDVRKLIEVL